MMVTAYIGLGANLDDPAAQVERAMDELARLPQSRWLGGSSLYASAPVGYAEQPDFINAVAALETRLSPRALPSSRPNAPQPRHDASFFLDTVSWMSQTTAWA